MKLALVAISLLAAATTAYAEPTRYAPISPERLAYTLLGTNDASQLWETKYLGKRIKWSGKYERKGVIVEFIVSTGEVSSISCRTMAPEHDAAKWKVPERWQAVRGEGTLFAYKKQMGKNKLEFVLGDCIARKK